MTGACSEPLIGVGRDCDCGFPLVWMRGVQRCSVYGRHPAPDDYVHFRNLHAPGALLVSMLLAEPAVTRQTLASRARLRAVS